MAWLVGLQLHVHTLQQFHPHPSNVIRVHLRIQRLSYDKEADRVSRTDSKMCNLSGMLTLTSGRVDGSDSGSIRSDMPCVISVDVRA